MILGIYSQIDRKVLNSKYATFEIKFEIIVHLNKINTIEKFV